VHISGPRPMILAALLAVVLAVLVAAPEAEATAGELTDDDYLTFADRVVVDLAGRWDPVNGYYRSGAPNFDSQFNAHMLVVHATAAARRWRGPSRDDTRARTIAWWLSQSPPYWTRPPGATADAMFHRPGWVGNMTGGYGVMHAMIDPTVAEGLQFAYRSRTALNLPGRTARAISRSIHAVARGPFFSYPHVRLNQINWPLELHLYDRLISHTRRLALEYRQQASRFLRQVRAGRNLGPSYRFLRGPGRPATAPSNLDSAEYANVVLDFLGGYDEARRAGMRALPARDVRLLRGWVRRALFGYWTHAGLLNWDTGMGLRRWMKGKYWAYAQRGLLTIATAKRFRTSAEGAWAKALFDRGLATFDRLGVSTGLPHSALFGIQAAAQRPSDDRVFAARAAANAAHAVWSGVGRMRGAEPPPFYAFDADIGRLAVSTPFYSTAIVAVDRGVLPYGGIDLARLCGGDGFPLSNLAGRGAAAFGVTVRDEHSRSVMSSEAGLNHDPRRPALILTHSPQGRVDVARPAAGPFAVLEALARRTNRRIKIVTRHRFTKTAIEVQWRVYRLHGQHSLTVNAHFPSSEPAADIDAELVDGRHVLLGSTTIPLRRIRRFRLSTGYLVRVLGSPSGTARAMRVGAQTGVPHPGPTLEVSLPGHPGRRPLTLRARISVR
jgi:hypothetical protein